MNLPRNRGRVREDRGGGEVNGRVVKLEKIGVLEDRAANEERAIAAAADAFRSISSGVSEKE